MMGFGPAARSAPIVACMLLAVVPAGHGGEVTFSAAAESPIPADASVEAIRARAKAGDRDAQNRLGELYQHGEGVAQDPTQAAVWYRRAADQGLAAAQLNLGTLYDNGEGVAKSDSEAARWDAKAARQGNVFAQLSLGISDREGR